MKQLLSCLVLTSAMYAQVSMPAVVVNSSGQSVHGLQKSDFSVDCGTGATVDAVEEVTPVALNNFADPTPVFILYDAPSIVLPIQGKVAKLLLGFLRRTANEHQTVTVLENTGTGVQVIHDLSIERRSST
jgi:hypothetical protein